MLKPYHVEVLRRMRNKGIIYWNYQPLETVASKIKWRDLARQYNVKRKFARVVRKLASKGYVSDHGKSGRVASITKLGIKLLEGLENDWKKQ